MQVGKLTAAHPRTTSFSIQLQVVTGARISRRTSLVFDSSSFHTVPPRKDGVLWGRCLGSVGAVSVYPHRIVRQQLAGGG